LTGYYLLPTFGAPYVILLALVSRNIGGRTKKAVGAGALFVGYCVGNIIGPYLVSLFWYHWIDGIMLIGEPQVNTSQAPVKYRTTWISIIVVMALTIVISLGLWGVLARNNRGRDVFQGHARDEAFSSATGKHLHLEERHGAGAGIAEEEHWRDEGRATDGTDMNFRYIL
jgi:MFS family permease